jgi:hypothetical protein
MRLWVFSIQLRLKSFFSVLSEEISGSVPGPYPKAAPLQSVG